MSCPRPRRPAASSAMRVWGAPTSGGKYCVRKTARTSARELLKTCVARLGGERAAVPPAGGAPMTRARLEVAQQRHGHERTRSAVEGVDQASARRGATALFLQR